MPSSSRSDRLLGIAAVCALHLAAVAALLWFAQPAIQRWMATPVEIQLISDAEHKTPEPPAAEPPKLRPITPHARPEPAQQPVPQIVPLLQTRAEAPADVAVMQAAPAPRDLPPPLPSPTAAAAGPTAPPAPAPVVAPQHDADYLDNPRPDYPSASRQLREEGRVWLRVQVSEDGRPLQVLITQGSGFRRLDAAARETVAQRWRFVPARQGERPVVGWVNFDILFELK